MLDQIFFVWNILISQSAAKNHLRVVKRIIRNQSSWLDKCLMFHVRPGLASSNISFWLCIKTDGQVILEKIQLSVQHYCSTEYLKISYNLLPTIIYPEIRSVKKNEKEEKIHLNRNFDCWKGCKVK